MLPSMTSYCNSEMLHLLSRSTAMLARRHQSARAYWRHSLRQWAALDIEVDAALHFLSAPSNHLHTRNIGGRSLLIMSLTINSSLIS